MNNHDEPLTPEERALAERVARLGAHGEPSPALDARILAAAHAAAGTPAQLRRPTRRWPIALGIAASLTLAVGIAWQLRPMQETATYDEAASATAVQAEMSASPAESAADTDAAGQQQPDAASQPDPATEPARAPAVESRRESAKVRSAPRAFIPAAAPPPPQEPPVVFDEAVAPVESAMPAPPPAASGVQAPPPAAPAAKTTSAESRGQAAQRNSVDAAAGAAAASRQDAFAEDAAAEDVPPATADSPEVRDAWLQRIRELARTGYTDDARASLREFVRRYPDHPLPDDLRTLLE